MLVFEEKGKMEYLEKTPQSKSREPTTHSTHMMLGSESNTGHIVGGESSHHCATLAMFHFLLQDEINWSALMYGSS